ncbi:MAG: type I glyceraldehyde-3-phosphate dehydrogenase [Candidatus Peregrinibacteria bacterium]
MKPLRLAIQGYGRIGRLLHRQLIELADPNIEVVAVNARSSDSTMRAHLLKYDSLHGRTNAEISCYAEHIIVNGKPVRSLNIANVEDLPWKELEIDVVLESTGKAKNKEIAQKHITAGAKKVLVSAPMKDDSPTFVFGVNDEGITDEMTVMSNASCTTNCIAPPMKVLEDAIGIENAYVSSIHSFTHSQNLLDNAGGDLRRARSAVQSIIPTTSGAMRAISKVIPSLEGKVDGLAFRVPIATSSICDVRFVFNREVTAEELNNLIREASKKPELKNILAVSEEELVSIDFKTDPHSSILDTALTKAHGKSAQMLFWYDNEWGYIARLVNFLQRLASF